MALYSAGKARDRPPGWSVGILCPHFRACGGDIEYVSLTNLHFCVLADLEKASCAGRWAAVVCVHLSLLTREDKSSIGDSPTTSFDGFLVWALAGTLHRDLLVVGGLL